MRLITKYFKIKRQRFEVGIVVGCPILVVLPAFFMKIIYNHFHNILGLFDVLPNFRSPQVKRCAIITYRHGINAVPRKLPNALRLRILGNYDILRKCLKSIKR